MAEPGGFTSAEGHGRCRAELTMQVIHGCWKLHILRELLEDIRRFSQLQCALQSVNQKLLTDALRESRSDGVVT